MAYCIANVKTVSSVASMRSIQDERLREKEFCNVDKNRSHLNEALTEEQDIVKLYNEAMKHDYYTKPDKWGKMHREPKIKAINIVLTYSPEAHIERTPEAFEKWKQDNIDFVKETFKGCPFVATLHMDETTPHLHIAIIPVTPSGKISKNQFIPNKNSLVKFQDAYAAKMKPYELQRGIHRERNSKELQQVTDQYRAILAKLEKQLAQLEKVNERGKAKVEQNKELLQAYNELVGSYNELVKTYNDLTKKKDELEKSCEDMQKYLELARYRYNEFKDWLPDLPKIDLEEQRKEEKKFFDKSTTENKNSGDTEER